MRIDIFHSFKSIFPAIVFLTALSSPTPLYQKKMDRLIVYGYGFRFGVQEPEGWEGDWKKASHLKANIIFYPKGHDLTLPDGIIRVRVNKKMDENTAEDLATDMEGYRKRFSEVQFDDLDITHPLYTCFPKLFFVENQFHEYVAYVNPGKRFWYMFSVALNTGENPATESELVAFKTVVVSLLAIDAVDSSGEKPSEFDIALKAADDNKKSKEGKRYDELFGLKAAPWVAKALAECTKGLSATELGPFTVLVRVGKSGRAEEVIVWPLSQVAECLKPYFVVAECPKPPGPSWWVRVDIAIR